VHLSIGPHTQRLIDSALDEDCATVDPSAEVFPEGHTSEARLIGKQAMTVAGQDVAEAVFERVDRHIRYEPLVSDGTAVEETTIIGTVAGPTASLLRGERTALNFLQRMCGVATKTKTFVDALGDPTTRITDTRKTLPGWRLLDKYAVRCGGGHNHRHNLAGGIIIKDNHIEAAGSIAEAVDQCRQRAPHTLKIEVEVETQSQLVDALEAGADIVMLDNMSTDEMRRAVATVRERAGREVLIEASGNVTVERLPELAGLGLDLISSGALTHSVEAADISMAFKE
jgi:nicotinate-nucleotide pyrophosphorylase (carboxylating)